MRKGYFRYFIALIPPEPLVSEVDVIRKEFVEKYRSKAALRSPAHITLHMPFQWREAKEERLFEALAQTTKLKPFDVELDGYGAFKPRSIFIKVKENQRLKIMNEELLLLTKRQLHLFHAVHKNGFHPHMTVAFRDLRKPEFLKAWQEFKERKFKAEFEVKSFWLLKHNGNNWQAYKEFVFQDS